MRSFSSWLVPVRRRSSSVSCCICTSMEKRSSVKTVRAVISERRERENESRSKRRELHCRVPFVNRHRNQDYSRARYAHCCPRLRHRLKKENKNKRKQETSTESKMHNTRACRTEMHAQGSIGNEFFFLSIIEEQESESYLSFVSSSVLKDAKAKHH